MSVWFNNRFVPDDQPLLQAGDRALLGDGVFDTMLAIDGEPVMGQAHMERLLRHAAVLNIEPPFSAKTLLGTARELLTANRQTHGAFTVKTILTMGPGARGLDLPAKMIPSCLMASAPAPKIADLPPVTAIISETTRRNEHSPLSRIKTLCYADNRLARQEAKRRGAIDALLLNCAGNIACATTGNVFALQNGRLITPPLADGTMDGVVRAAVINHADVLERSLSPDDLEFISGLYITNSVSGVRAVVELDGKKLDSTPLEVARLFPFF